MRSNQPFNYKNYTLLFNGEIYNFKELRQECENNGYHFKTEGDTEVLLALYIRFREKCLDKLNGFFAFAVYDQESETVFVARDRFGIKPLYYFIHNDTLYFSSEIKFIKSINN